MNVNGLEVFSEEVEFFPNGSLHEATLIRDTFIQGIPCLGNRDVVFFPSGRLKLCWLSKTTVIEGIHCLGGSIIYFHENGKLFNASLAVDHQIAEILYPSGCRLTLDETGKLLEYSEQFDLDRTIEGFPCSSQFVVWRYVDRKPSVIVLAASFTIAGEEYPRGTMVFFNRQQEVIDWQPVNLDSGKRYKQRIFCAIEGDWL